MVMEGVETALVEFMALAASERLSRRWRMLDSPAASTWWPTDDDIG